ncbi:hypothetical protein OVA11_13180 [Caulobacter sp. SL161]|uniref:hypothetical protein n=1 Tax=Caulobacter sp. SL161 TaxID=2995156 RepID=UPI002275EA10|nr:hypothetical protein [Caulobacter sp. SL161]MCY1647978.1 hypothetical protein [Caulobacter sp. SL161]
MLATAVTAFALATMAPAAPPAAVATSPTEAARYALTHGCLAAAHKGVKLASLSNPFIVLADKGRGIYLMKGAGQILMSDSPHRSAAICVSGRATAKSCAAWRWAC